MTATGPAGPPDLADQRRDEGGLAGPGRPGDPDQMRPAGQRVEPPKGRLGDRRPVLDRGQQPGEREPVARDRGIGQARPPGSWPRRPPR